MTVNPKVNPKKLRPYDTPPKRRRSLIPGAPDSAANGFLAAAAVWFALASGLGVLAILLRIGQISKGALTIEQGALYPALFRLVGKGLLKAKWGISENNQRAKFYELTAAGRKRLREEIKDWDRLVAAIGTVLSTEL